MPLAVYLKNFADNYAKQVMLNKDGPERVQYIERLAQILTFFI